jgi:CRISPR/Cas system CMR subunit Cmr4 (Cas7 group RAMP superfamily)
VVAVTVTFEVCFHTPFRVAAGHAADGADTVVDRQALLPASSLKGVMLSAARDLLGLPERLVAEVYGSRRLQQPSSWSWSDGRLDQQDVRTRARIQLSDQTGTVTDGALAVAEEVLAGRATFMVRRSGPVPETRRPVHLAVLLASGRAVTALGGDRRRGLGWVSVTPLDPPWTATSAEHLVTLLQAEASTAGSPPTADLPDMDGQR